MPLDGSRSGDGYYYTPVAEVAALWAEAQGCGAAAVPVGSELEGDDPFACVEHPDCDHGVAVRVCTWAGAHDWPRGEARNWGAELLWSFFDRAPR